MDAAEDRGPLRGERGTPSCAATDAEARRGGSETRSSPGLLFGVAAQRHCGVQVDKQAGAEWGHRGGVAGSDEGSVEAKWRFGSFGWW